MKIEMLDPKTLNPSAYNPRKIKPEEMESLRRSTTVPWKERRAPSDTSR
jgi:hypothetical protein